ncbi:unnamed protein product [Effrenium voratum]|nr:unnamed protein product [Effrenium voratum]
MRCAFGGKPCLGFHVDFHSSALIGGWLSARCFEAWQITARRGCNEFVVRYDCGHSLRAEVWAPCIPSTEEYGTHDAERIRYGQHCLHVLTRDPGATQVQVTVPEGRCRHCQRGQRQTLVCGPVHADLREPAAPGLVAKALARAPLDALTQAKRVDLPMTAQAFLATIGQVCKLPDAAELPSPAGAQEAALDTPFAAEPLPKEEIRRWTRKEVEDELESKLSRYICCATMVLMLLVAECFYLLGIQLTQEENSFDEIPGDVEVSSMELDNLTSLSSLELRMANSTWVLSALTLGVHKALGPGDGDAGSTGVLWSAVHPLWVGMLLVLAPLLRAMELLVATPRLLILHVLFAGVRELLLRPGSFILGIMSSMLLFLVRSLFSPPTLFVTSGPTANPILGAAFICVALAAITSPIPLTLLAHDLCSVVASLQTVRRLRRAMARNKVLGRLLDRFHLGQSSGRAKGSRGIAKGKEYKGDRPPRSDSGKGDKLQAKDERSTFVPSCFVCLDKPSRYILEPCGHRVVCGDCAVQLVDAAARSRTATEAADRGGDRCGGNCPSCGLAISRAMRIFT